MLCGRPVTHDVSAFTGSVSRASCLVVLTQAFKRQYPVGNQCFRGSPAVCGFIDFTKILILVDRWLLSSGVSPSQLFLSIL